MTEMTRVDLERMVRWTTTAKTWFGKAVRKLEREGERARDRQEARWLVGYEAERLLSSALWEATSLVPLLNDEQVEDVLHRSRELTTLLRNRVLVAKLENVDGRTEEEAAAFRAKAASLR